MPATLNQVKTLIQKAFPGADVSALAEENGRIGGAIRFQGFSGMPTTERNKQITIKVRDKLGIDGLNIGTIYPLASENNEFDRAI